MPRAPWWGYSRHADAAGEEALRLLSAAGAIIVDDVDLGALGTFGWDNELVVMLAEFPGGLAEYLEARPGDVPRTLEDIIDFNLRRADVELAHFGQSLLERALTAPGVESQEYTAARATCLQVSRADGIDRALSQRDLDALITPSYAPAAPIDLVNEKTPVPGSCSQPAALAGYPPLTVPVNLAAGLPVAVTFWGTAASEATLIEIAAGFEAARDRELGSLPEPTFTDFV